NNREITGSEARGGRGLEDPPHPCGISATWVRSAKCDSRVPAERASAREEPGPSGTFLSGKNPGFRCTPSGLRYARLFVGLAPMPTGASLIFTMSNSAVFFVPAARCCARVLLSPEYCLQPHQLGWDCILTSKRSQDTNCSRRVMPATTRQSRG